MNILTQFRFPESFFDEAQRARIGAAGIQALQSRFDNSRDVTDGPATPYSPHGPVYLPLTHSAQWRRSGRVKVKVREARLASSLRGRYSISQAQARKAFIAGQRDKAFAQAYASLYIHDSMKFANYSEMKQFLGHPATPDLMLSGKMRKAITIVENIPHRVSIGFLDGEQENKMKGNQRWRDMWGWSPEDERKITEQFEQELRESLANLGFA
jgi:hypothetical protein